MSSLDRLIDLAKRTGDRLIVHDPIEGRDVIIMDVDEYERMVLPKKDVRGLSSRQMLDQINRDIAVWRANLEMEEQWAREEMLEDEIDAEGPFDPFAETDFYAPEWHSAGNVIGELYNQKIKSSEDQFSDLDIDEEEIEVEEVPPQMSATVEEDEELSVKPVPQSEHVDEYLHDGGKLKEESLVSEEPVFYEEPV